MSDRDRLRAALRQIDAPCPFCSGSFAEVKWDAEARRHLVKTLHGCRTCPALVPGPFQDRAETYLISLLELYGVVVGDYGDAELVGWHAARRAR